MREKRARIGVIGTGWWSTYTHIPGLLDNPRAELVALCDTDPAALELAQDAFPGPATFREVGALLRDTELDGVVVAVPHVAHREVAAACLNAGVHVLLEKPMTLLAADAVALIELAGARQRELIIGYPWHFTRTAIRARELIAARELGSVQHVACLFSSMVIEFYRGNDEAYREVFDWKVTGPGGVYADRTRSGGGQGHLQVTHSSGLMFFMTGLRARRVSALMNDFDLSVDLVDALTVQFEGGALGVVGSTGNIPIGDAGQLDVRVYCERGYVLLDAVKGALTVRRHAGDAETVQLEPDDTYPRFATAANLVDVCLGRAPNGSPADVGRRSVELLEAAYRSAAAGGTPIEVAELYA